MGFPSTQIFARTRATSIVSFPFVPFDRTAFFHAFSGSPSPRPIASAAPHPSPEVEHLRLGEVDPQRVGFLPVPKGLAELPRPTVVRIGRYCPVRELERTGPVDQVEPDLPLRVMLDLLGDVGLLAMDRILLPSPSGGRAASPSQSSACRQSARGRGGRRRGRPPPGSSSPALGSRSTDGTPPRSPSLLRVPLVIQCKDPVGGGETPPHLLRVGELDELGGPGGSRC